MQKRRPMCRYRKIAQDCFGTPLGKCIVKDISEHGAKITYSAVEELPNEIFAD